MEDIKKNEVTELPETVEVVGIRFKEAGKVYYFDPHGIKLSPPACAIVETARGLEYGFVASGNHTVPSSEIVPPLRPVVRMATKDDKLRYENNLELEKDAYAICQKKIADHGLDMKLIEAEYTFDNSKGRLLFI